MRKSIVAALAALMLSACGGETYPVAPTQAFLSLSEVGSSNIAPLPGGLYAVDVSFESIPADNAVEWRFSHEGDDLAKIVARVTPDGDSSSNVSIEYVNGTAPDENWRNGEARRLLKTGVFQLVSEAVDSKMESRPFDTAIRDEVVKSAMMTSMGGIMKDVSASMDAEIKRRADRDHAAETNRYINPNNATKPMTDLSKYN